MRDDAIQAFDALYRASEDPWETSTRWYERRKRRLLLATLPRERYASSYEPGCGNGLFTSALAERCDCVMASDASEIAVGAARRRLDHMNNVAVERHVLPRDWPSRQFELVVLSELVYFLEPDAIEQLGIRVRDSIAEHGLAIACDWRAPIAGYGHSGEEAHRMFEAAIALPLSFEYFDPDFIISAWSLDTTSPAMREAIR